ETTVEDWKRALDLTVIKQGVFNWIFHPHGWIRNDQLIAFIDYATATYGKRIRFLTFKEALNRMEEHLLSGNRLRSPEGKDAGIRLLDADRDGYMDVLLGGVQPGSLRLWSKDKHAFENLVCPVPVLTPDGEATGVKHGVFWEGGGRVWLYRDATSEGAWMLGEDGLEPHGSVISEFRCQGRPVPTVYKGNVDGVIVHDIDRDGLDEVIVGYPGQQGVLKWNPTRHTWDTLPYAWPKGLSLVDARGLDAGVRLVDINEDGHVDLLHSDEEHYAAYIFIPEFILGFQEGWSRLIMKGDRGDEEAIPAFVRPGKHRDNGAWFARGQVWVQNEDTAHLPDLVDRKSFRQILLGSQPRAQTVQEALVSFQLDPSLEIQCVASEPLVEDPVAFEWSADGSLWVAEMRDYPLGLGPDAPPGGRIRRLKDLDGDGIYDTSTVFLDKVPFPSGLFPWGNGVWISAAPDVFFAADLDADGKADTLRRLFTGFGEGNQQHRVNGFEYGLDHRLYGANGDSGGVIRSLWSEKVSRLRLRDFEFDPVTGVFQAIEGQTQFGRRRDDWGNWFGNNNPNWIWHYHFPDRYHNRVSHAGPFSSKTYLAADLPSRKVDQIAVPLQRYNDVGMRGHVTSACSATPYRDRVLFDDGRQHVFVSEPVHNLVRHFVLEREGVSFDARRPENEMEREFLASKDPWFRPTMLKTGPDGGLYIADMYRLVIEHTEWIPDDVEQLMDPRSGTEKGRIYRVLARNTKNRRQPDKISTATAKEWLELLQSDNGWKRDQAQMWLVETRGAGQIEALKSLMHSGKAKTRVHVLWTLHHVRQLEVETLRKAFLDPHPEVRRNALILSEQARYRDTDGSGGEWAHLYERLLGDNETFVRHQAICSLGAHASAESSRLMVEAMHQEAQEEAMQDALISSSNHHLKTMVEHGLACDACRLGVVMRSLVQIAVKQKAPWIGASIEESVLMLTGIDTASGLQTSFPSDLTRQLKERREFDQTSSSVIEDQHNTVQAAYLINAFLKAGGRALINEDNWMLSQNLSNQVARLLMDPVSRKDRSRVVLFAYLIGVEAIHDWEHWMGCLMAASFEITLDDREAILRLLMTSGAPLDAGMTRWIESAWNTASLQERRMLLALVLKQPAWTRVLLESIRSGFFVSTGEAFEDGTLTAEMEMSLRRLGDKPLHTLALVAMDRRRERMGLSRLSDQTVSQRFETLAKLSKDTGRGAGLFLQNCGMCHRFHG
ncbi:hypothetical protein OAK97_02845, partial [bacterium]|nr:hypothetical protein [bacterium]